MPSEDKKPPEKKPRPKAAPYERSVGNRRVRGGYLVDCIKCGGGKNRCRLCRGNKGKVWVKE